ncbi:hypothetical protein [Streptomyces sp. NBC_00470]|uniref:hypothetical protein n=1 Tax=Streptomyces sp. NBC_00470 TaxID=2975753 RepID=UPI002F906FD6
MHERLLAKVAALASVGRYSRYVAWNTLNFTIDPAQGLCEPQYGTGGWSHDEAHSEVQNLLLRLASEHQPFAAAADVWRTGAEDDTTFVRVGEGMVVFALYEYPDSEDPVHAALEWIDDFSRRASGQPARLIVPPTGPGGTFST